MSIIPEDPNDPNVHLAFMYGTLKSTEPNHIQLFVKGPGGAKFCGRAKTVGKYPLVVTTPFNIPFLLHKEGTGHRIDGELYRLDEETFKHVDWFEDHPNWYVRKLVKVELYTDEADTRVASRVVECWMYGLARFKKSLLDMPLVEEYHDNPQDKQRRYRPYTFGKDEPLKPYLFDD